MFGVFYISSLEAPNPVWEKTCKNHREEEKWGPDTEKSDKVPPKGDVLILFFFMTYILKRICTYKYLNTFYLAILWSDIIKCLSTYSSKIDFHNRYIFSVCWI